VSRAYLYCQNHVQRLRVFVQATDISGSRGLARRMPFRGLRIFIFCMSFLGHAGILRSMLSLCCSNSRRGFVSPVDWDWQVLSVRLCESEPWMISRMKSAGALNYSKIPAQIAAFQGWALSRIHYILTTTACWLEARTGTFPPFNSQPP
jgi:hypothetical protein